MHRAKLLRLLNLYDPRSFLDCADEVIFKQEIIFFIKNNKNCFDRSNDGHITASAWILNKDGTQALLTHHAKLGNWFQLGGHCDGESDVIKVAIKEAKEESGIDSIELINDGIFDIDVHLIPKNQKEEAHYHYDIRFLLQVKGDEELRISQESKELRWIEKNKSTLPTRQRSVTRMFDKWLSLTLMCQQYSG